MVFKSDDAWSFSGLTPKIPPLGSMLNFDADVKNMTARHQYENRWRGTVGVRFQVRQAPGTPGSTKGKSWTWWPNTFFVGEPNSAGVGSGPRFFSTPPPGRIPGSTNQDLWHPDKRNQISYKTTQSSQKHHLKVAHTMVSIDRVTTPFEEETLVIRFRSMCAAGFLLRKRVRVKNPRSFLNV